MPTCFVPGCTSGYKSNPEKRHFFAPPSDPQLLERWVRAIPRADKLLSKTCKVCDVHFMQHDIVKTYKHAIDGQVVEIDRGCWALQPEAVPCQFPNVPSYLSKTIKRRRSPKDRASLPNKVVLVATPSDEYQQEVPDPVHDIDFAQIVENGSSLKLPKNWRMADLEEDTGKPRQVIFYKAGMKDDVYAILKSVAIHEDLTYVIHANGRLLRSWDAEINIFSAQDVEAIVQIVHAKQFCRGCPLIDVTNSSRVTKKVGGRLHHNDCAVLTDADKEVCAACANLTKSLKRKATSTRSKRKVPVAASALRKRLIRATAARERKKADVKHLSEKLKNALTATLDDIIKASLTNFSVNLPTNLCRARVTRKADAVRASGKRAGPSAGSGALFLSRTFLHHVDQHHHVCSERAALPRYRSVAALSLGAAWRLRRQTTRPSSSAVRRTTTRLCFLSSDPGHGLRETARASSRKVNVRRSMVVG
ncbi:hypothetical protein HPB51_011202 [Rhipicephalus microplus]|uniref:THAP-type domain-containing protein n=1 Tax=Rhipicephalus microplus TaxID=6941 RepID=A0A9J6F1B3_RHIMP|nr:hypothetical protein HPB51_011202 [Rhipicephalus microplus]